MDLITYRETQGTGAFKRLADAAGLQPAYVSLLVGGHRGMSYDMAVRLVQASGGVLEVASLMKQNGEACAARRKAKAAA